MEVPLPSLFPLGAVVLLSGLVLTPNAPPSAPPRVFWASLWRLVLSLSLLVFPGPAVSARVSSSLSTTHHVHHFHNKHGTVPIAINRMPFLTRGGHGRSCISSYYISVLLICSFIANIGLYQLCAPSFGCHLKVIGNLALNCGFMMFEKLCAVVDTPTRQDVYERS